MAIEVKTIKDISPQLRTFYDRGKQAAASKNYSYAFDMWRTLLRKVPGLVDVRMEMRQAQLEKIGNKASQARQIVALLKVAIPLKFNGPALLKKGDFGKALDFAEAQMEADPTLWQSLSFLMHTAEQAGLIDVAINAAEIGMKFNPKSSLTFQEVTDLFERLGDFKRAILVIQRLKELQPNNMEVEDHLKRLSAKGAMKDGKWEQAGSYRDIMKDKELAESLEQKERIGARDEDTLRSLIADAEKTVAKQPTAQNYKRLAELHAQAREWDKALDFYNKTIEAFGSMDPSIEEAITKVMAGQYDDAIAQWQAYGADPANAAQAESEVANLTQQKSDMLFSRAVDRVNRYPNETKYRFELASMYFERGQFDEALEQFQVSERNPQLKRPSLVYLGKCFAAKGMAELAFERFKAGLEASGPRMDATKKEILYNLGVTCEQMSRREEAMNYFKEIYSADVNYLDVAKRMEAYYKK